MTDTPAINKQLKDALKKAEELKKELQVVRDKNSFYSTVVFAESSNKAKAIAMHTDACEDVPYIDICAKRMPTLDKYYRGKNEMDWYDDDDRIALVKDGKFHCFEVSECPNCPAKEYCDYKEVEE